MSECEVVVCRVWRGDEHTFNTRQLIVFIDRSLH